MAYNSKKTDSKTYFIIGGIAVVAVLAWTFLTEKGKAFKTTVTGLFK